MQNFQRKHVDEAIEKLKDIETEKDREEWLYDEYKKVNGNRRHSRTYFIVIEGYKYPLKPFWRLVSECAGINDDRNYQSKYMANDFRRLGYYVLHYTEPEEQKRRKVWASIFVRNKQNEFRTNLFNRYKYCVVTGCSVLEAIEAAHIKPVSKGGCDDVTNGLLLRADLHLLFDAELMKFEAIKNNKEGKFKVVFSEDAQQWYKEFHGKIIVIDCERTRRALADHRQ